MKQPRITPHTQAVLDALQDAPNGRYGLELAGMTGLKTGTIYPILCRLVRAGWVERRWEAEAEIQPGRPRRRYYTLTNRDAQ